MNRDDEDSPSPGPEFHWTEQFPCPTIEWQILKAEAELADRRRDASTRDALRARAQAVIRSLAGSVEGVQKPVFYKGEVCGYITEYSDTMLAMLANGFMPEKYKQKARIEAEVTSWEVVREGLRKLSDEELAEYERLLTKAMGPTTGRSRASDTGASFRAEQ